MIKVFMTITSAIFARWNDLAHEFHESISGFIELTQDAATFIAIIVGSSTIYSWIKDKLKK